MKRNLTTERDPTAYIRTGKTMVLAIIKLIEGLAGCFAVWYLLTHMNMIPNVLNNLLEIQTNGESQYAAVYQEVFSGLQIGVIILSALLIPDGLTGFFMRFTGKGAGAEAFFRIFSFTAGIIVFSLGIAGMILYCNSVIEATRTIRYITIGELIRIFGTVRVVAFLTVYVIICWIVIIYHFRAYKLLLHVRKEVKMKSILKPDRKNRLGSAVTACAIVFAINTILSVLILVTDEKQLSDIAGFLQPVMSAYRLSGTAGIAASIILTLKFCLVSWCNADFNKTHRELIDPAKIR